MKKNKMSLTTELDLTREGTAEMTRWCILIALHQSFGVGAARLNKILARAEKLGQESLDVAMTVNERVMPSTDRSLALRRSWMPEGVDPDFRVPVLRSPRTRREEQLRMAGDVAASMVWTLCVEACIEELGFGAGRLNRLKEEALANYRQVNEEGHTDGLDVAMEHLRRCAQDALKEEVTVDEQPDEDRVRQSERDYEEQKRAFLKRAVMQQLGRRAGKGSLRVLSEKKLEEKAAAAMAQLKENTCARLTRSFRSSSTRPCGTTSRCFPKRGTTPRAMCGSSPAGRRSISAVCITRRTSTTIRAKPSTLSAWTN